VLNSNTHKAYLVDTNNLFRRCYLRSCPGNRKGESCRGSGHHHKQTDEFHRLQNNLTRCSVTVTIRLKPHTVKTELSQLVCKHEASNVTFLLVFGTLHSKSAK